MAVVNNASVIMEVQISLQDSDFISFGFITSSEIAGSYGSSIFIFLKKEVAPLKKRESCSSQYGEKHFTGKERENSFYQPGRT